MSSLKNKEIEIDGNAYKFGAAINDGKISIEIDGETFEFETQKINEATSFFKQSKVGGAQTQVSVVRDDSNFQVAFKEMIFSAEIAGSKRRSKKGGDHGGNQVISPMPGKILRIMVVKGDAVSKGQPLLVMEAMKMEHTMKAPFDGVVLSIDCTVGGLVQGGVELVQLEEKKGE